LPADLNVEGLSLDQYLARLAAEATTIINAEDYGQLIYCLSVRRALIEIAGDVANFAYDAPVEATPSTHIENAERKLYEIAETGRRLIRRRVATAEEHQQTGYLEQHEKIIFIGHAIERSNPRARGRV
jgi:replicative DNA helicase